MFAYADSWTGTGGITWLKDTTGSYASSYQDISLPASNVYPFSATKLYNVGLLTFELPVGDTDFSLTGAGTLVISYYPFRATTNATASNALISPVGDVYSGSSYYAYWINANGQRLFDPDAVTATNFYPDSGANYAPYGVMLQADFSADEIDSFSSVGISVNTDSSGYPVAYFDTDPTSNNWTTRINVVSARFITTQTSAELDALKSMASGIAETNEILRAMYGDILAVCNSIYSRLGDMKATMELANQYFSRMVTELESIDTTTTNIYSLLQTQFDLLIRTIEAESTEIQSCINAGIDRMIEYFESIQNVTEVPPEIVDQTQEGDVLQNEMDALAKPETDSLVPSLDSYLDDGFDGFNLVFPILLEYLSSLLLISLSIAFVAYVLYGKR